MATIIGTDANDVMSGTTGADRMEGGGGNDRINAGAGDDEIYGGLGSDILTGDAGNDRIFGEDGNDGVYGGGGDDYIDGGIGDDILIGDGGNDIIIGGVGNDRLFGGTGDDVFVYRSGDGSDTIVGGTGNDRIELHLNEADITDALRTDFEAYDAWAASQLDAAGSEAALAAQSTGGTFTFSSLGLTISALEGVSIFVSGQAVAMQSMLNAAPVASAQTSFAIEEDGTLEAVVEAHDAEGDALSFVVEKGPANGTVTLDEVTGAYVYRPVGDYSGQDSFTVRVSDPSGASVVQVVTVDVAAVADQPMMSMSDAEVSLVRPIRGTQGNDVLLGDQYAAMETMTLNLSAALQDVDGSETLSVQIAGIPDRAVLSAGIRNADGTWTLQASDLLGLSMTTPTAQDLALQVTATAHETTGDVAVTSGTMHVTFQRGGFADSFIASAGNDIYDGGTGFDTIDYSASTTGVQVDLSSSTAIGFGIDRLSNIEGVIGTAAADRLWGDSADNVFAGGAGNDRVDGGAGDDVIIAGEGNDRYDGGTGFDTVDYSGATQAISVDVGRKTVTGMGNDRIDDIEKVVGSTFDDVFFGGKDDDVFVGGDGDDWFRGMEGQDRFTGGAGNDTFVWETRDVVKGKNALGPDTITDLSSGDVLDLSAITRGGSAESVVRLTETEAGSMLSVKVGSSFIDVVFLEDVHGATASSMVVDGLLLL